LGDGEMGRRGETWGWVLGFWNADLTDSLMRNAGEN
jgi:hypothetical protein